MTHRYKFFFACFWVLLLSSSFFSPRIGYSAALTALTDGVWAEYVAARSDVEMIGTGLAGGGALYSALAGNAWVLDKAKVPGKVADIKFGSTPKGIVSRTATASNLIATAAASSTANTLGPMGTGISATYFGVADAWAGVGISYKHSGSKIKNRVFGKVLEMTLDPLPPSPYDITIPNFAGQNIPVVHTLSVDVQLPGTSEWTSIYNAQFSLQWNLTEKIWDLSINDPTGQFSKSDFTMTTEMISYDLLGTYLPTTVWTLNSPKEFFADFWTTNNLLETGNEWSANAEYGTQVQIQTEGITSAIPEPSSFILIMVGVVIIYWMPASPSACSRMIRKRAKTGVGG